MRRANRSFINVYQEKVRHTRGVLFCPTSVLGLMTVLIGSAHTPPRVIKQVAVFAEAGRFAG